MKKMQIYDPAMCCPTGVCGPSVDKELIRISTILYNLKKNGITVERFNLSSTPQVYVDNETINSLLTGEGVEVLPVIVVEGEVMKTKGYPTDEEFCQWLGVSEACLRTNLTALGTAPCCDGGKC